MCLSNILFHNTYLASNINYQRSRAIQTPGHSLVFFYLWKPVMPLVLFKRVACPILVALGVENIGIAAAGRSESSEPTFLFT
eukprot:scaffold174756_cov40-Prasinocladus_malaysianus.AAC.2